MLNIELLFSFVLFIHQFFYLFFCCFFPYGLSLFYLRRRLLEIAVSLTKVSPSSLASCTSQPFLSHTPLPRFFNPLTPSSDKHEISPNNINTLFGKQVMSIFKIVRLKLLS